MGPVTPESLLAALRGRGVEVQAEGCRLRIRAPRGVLTEDDRSALTLHRDELLVLLGPLRELFAAFPDARLICRGRQLCRGCRAPMPAHSNGYCFCCTYGLDTSDFSTRLMRHALALHAELGPAGGRGLRVEAIRERARGITNQTRRSECLS